MCKPEDELKWKTVRAQGAELHCDLEKNQPNVEHFVDEKFVFDTGNNFVL